MYCIYSNYGHNCLVLCGLCIISQYRYYHCALCQQRLLACDWQIAYKVVDRRAGDVASVYGDPSKAAEELGFKATKTLKDMCKYYGQ